MGTYSDPSSDQGYKGDAMHDAPPTAQVHARQDSRVVIPGEELSPEQFDTARNIRDL